MVFKIPTPPLHHQNALSVGTYTTTLFIHRPWSSDLALSVLNNSRRSKTSCSSFIGHDLQISSFLSSLFHFLYSLNSRLYLLSLTTRWVSSCWLDGWVWWRRRYEFVSLVNVEDPKNNERFNLLFFSTLQFHDFIFFHWQRNGSSRGGSGTTKREVNRWLGLMVARLGFRQH